MSPIPIINELESLIRKYEDVCTPLDLLRMIGSVAKLEEANILLHDRMKRDVFSLFGKSEDGTMLSNTGSRLMLLSRVTKYHTAHSCNQFHVDATVEFAESNAFTNKKAETDNNGKMSSGKRRRDEPAPTLVLHEPVYLQYLFTEQTVGTGSGTGDVRREKGVSVMESPYKSINLTITMCRGAGGVDKATLLDFQLLTAGCSPSDQQISLQDLMDGQQMQDDDEGSINDENEESDKCSNDGSEGDGDEGGAAGPVDGCGGEGESGGEDDADSAAGGSDSDSRTDSKEGLETGEEGGEGEEGEEGELEEDTADYYNVNVSSEALAQLKEWLQYRSLEEEQEQEDALCSNDSSTCKDQDLPRRKRGPTGAASRDAEEEEESDEESNEDDSNDGDEEGNGEEESSQPHGTPYDRDPALGELLQFLLSLPYVDEAWGVQDLILDHELGAAGGEGESQGEGVGEGEDEDAGSGDEDEICHPCCRR